MTRIMNIRRLILAGVAAASIAPACAAEPTHWFMAQLDAEACVPLEGISPNDLSRVYYGSGPMKTPDDFASALRSKGIILTLDPASKDGMVGYIATRPRTGQSANFVMFNNKYLCQLIVSAQEK